ncbi:MAG: NAD-dependent epimerase/dehydratase family protein, partial [Pirellulales bacterium]
MTKLVVGCGYLGARVARRWARLGETVYGVVRSDTRADALAREGIRPLVADVLAPSTLDALPPAETVVFSVARQRAARESLHGLLVTGLANVLASLSTLADRLIVISSTGVYGQRDGEWVDEASPCEPQRAGGRACLAAERVPSTLGWEARTIVLRLAGIYGPQRVPHRDLIVAGHP